MTTTTHPPCSNPDRGLPLEGDPRRRRRAWALALGTAASCVIACAANPPGGGQPGIDASGGAPFGTGGAIFATGGSTVPSCFSDVGGNASAAAPSFMTSTVGVPQLGGTVTLAQAPPAVSGGTLRVLADGHTAVAADPDRDQIYIVDLTTAALRATVSLMPGDEPGRIVQDGAGRVHVALRRGGAVVTLDLTRPPAEMLTKRRPVCPAPRGLAYDARLDQVHVACAGGELVSLPAADGAAVRTVKLDRDLRDVVVDGDHLLVSRFRSAQVITLDAAGIEQQRLTPASFRSFEARGNQVFSASTAWRMTEMPGGGAAMVHQRGLEDEVPTQPGGYGNRSPCDAIVHSTMTVMRGGKMMTSTPALVGMVLATDMAISADGKRVAVIASGNGHNADSAGGEPTMPRVFVTDVDAATDHTVGCRPDGRHAPCLPGFASFGVAPAFDTVSSGPSASVSLALSATGGASGFMMATGGTSGSFSGGPADPACASSNPAGGLPDVRGEPIGVQFDGSGKVVVQTREPAALFLASGAQIALSPASRGDTGHAVFHSNSGGFLACASCHPEGSEDGRVWNFTCEGARRTQTLAAGLAGTEPFHWNGDLGGFPELMSTVFIGRMSGPRLASEQVDATFQWINRQPRVPAPPPSDSAAVARGQALFEDSTRGACASCHAGPKLSNNANADVGTGGVFQVPSLLGLSARAPFMHDGCAKTLADRFSRVCGGGDKHGVTSGYTAADVADLTAYLESL